MLQVPHKYPGASVEGELSDLLEGVCFQLHVFAQTGPRVRCCFRATIPGSFWERKKTTQGCHRSGTWEGAMALLELSQKGPKLCIKATNSQQHRCCLSAAISSSPACVHLFKKLHCVTLAHLLPSLTCLFVFLFSIPNFLCSGALFHQREDGWGNIFLILWIPALCYLTNRIQKSHITYWSCQIPFSSCSWPSDPAQGHKMEKIIMSFGVQPQAEGYLPSNMLLTWVQTFSVQWGQKLHVTHALSSLPTHCQCCWYYPQQDQLWQGEFTPAIVRGLAVISLQNCFPWCTRDITNG